MWRLARPTIGYREARESGHSPGRSEASEAYAARLLHKCGFVRLKCVPRWHFRLNASAPPASYLSSEALRMIGGIGQPRFASRDSVLIVLACAAAFGQTPAQRAFEVAFVKPTPSAAEQRRTVISGGPGTPDPGLATFTNVTLARMLMTAFWDLTPMRSGQYSLGEQRAR
jgi:hypothetical protein